MNVLFVLGSRGEWGYIKPVIEELNRRGHHSEIWACNMSVLSRFGNLAEEISLAGFNVSQKSLTALEGDNRLALSKSFGLTALSFADHISNHSYEWVVFAGDRVEQLSAVIVAGINYIPIAHIQAGEKSGNIDGVSRHAIARFAHVHFASNVDAAERLERSGEDKSRVYITGAPQLDEIDFAEIPNIEELKSRKIIRSQEFVLAVLHGTTEDEVNIASQAEALISELTAQELPIVWIGSNNDSGSTKIGAAIKSSLRLNDKYYVNLNRLDYLSLLANCAYLIGNSSSGILEAPTFKTPVVNLGRRQDGRIKAENVIQGSFERNSIRECIAIVQSAEFRDICSKVVNPYGSGNSSKAIVDILQSIKVDHDFLTKQIAF